ncbi:MAG: AI-2E family transporter [Kiritimatiellaeota bacterium]|nr:AI-2E family transporter [Kiritimatiellota bacterium]
MTSQKQPDNSRRPCGRPSGLGVGVRRRAGRLRAGPDASRKRPVSTLRHRATGAPIGRSVESPYVLAILTLVSLYGAYLILRPFLHALILGLLLAMLFHPLHRLLHRRLHGRRNLAAICSVLIVVLLVIAPALLFAGALVNQGIETFQEAQAWLKAGKLEEALDSPRFRDVLRSPAIIQVTQFFGVYPGDIDLKKAIQKLDLPAKLLEASRTALRFGATQIVPILSKTGELLFNFFLMFFLMFYAFRDGERLLAWVLHLSPLNDTQEKALLARIRGVTRGVVIGALGTAACQGLVAMIGFRIVGVPALFWGTVLALGSLIPLVGAALVWVPAALYLLIAGHPWSALFLVLWCIFLVGTVDNFVRPILMHGATGMSSAVLFLALIGGLRCFGPVGILYGPLIFGLCAVCLYIYELENHEFLSLQDRT